MIVVLFLVCVVVDAALVVFLRRQLVHLADELLDVELRMRKLADRAGARDDAASHWR